MNFCPYAFCVKYSDIINNVIIRYFNEHSDNFTKIGNNYVLSKGCSRNTLTKTISKYIDSEVGDILATVYFDYKDTLTKYIFVVDSGDIRNNINVLNVGIGDMDNIPNTNAIYSRRFSLVEKDIIIDFPNFDKIFDNLFIKNFSKKSNLKNKIFFVRHNQLSAIQLISIIKSKYGKIFEPYVVNRVIVDVTELPTFKNISKCVKDVEIIINEVRDYLDIITEKYSH